MYLKVSPEEISSSLDISPRVLLTSKGVNSYAGLVVLIGLIIGHTTMTVFVVLAHLVGCLFFFFFLFFGGRWKVLRWGTLISWCQQGGRLLRSETWSLVGMVQPCSYVYNSPHQRQKMSSPASLSHSPLHLTHPVGPRITPCWDYNHRTQARKGRFSGTLHSKEYVWAGPKPARLSSWKVQAIQGTVRKPKW